MGKINKHYIQEFLSAIPKNFDILEEGVDQSVQKELFDRARVGSYGDRGWRCHRPWY